MFFKNVKKYRIGSFDLLLPKKHSLPKFKEEFKLYDEFLPFLVKNLTRKGVIVDVGANCGDTLLSIYFDDNEYYCFEPDGFFYSFLLDNIKLNNLKNIHVYNDFIGIGANKRGCLAGNQTTKKVVDSESYIEYKKLDDFIVNKNNVILIKTDIDGFDYEALYSAERVIAKNKPLVYFEAQFNVKIDLEKYVELIEWFQEKDYSYCVVFDNFGQVFYRGFIDIYFIKNIFNYVFNQNFGDVNRTIYYYDILLAVDGSVYGVESIIEKYVESYIL